jgi:hypothetical protein
MTKVKSYIFHCKLNKWNQRSGCNKELHDKIKAYKLNKALNSVFSKGSIFFKKTLLYLKENKT